MGSLRHLGGRDSPANLRTPHLHPVYSHNTTPPSSLSCLCSSSHCLIAQIATSHFYREFFFAFQQLVVAARMLKITGTSLSQCKMSDTYRKMLRADVIGSLGTDSTLHR